MENPLCDEFADLNFGTPILSKDEKKKDEEQSVKTSHHSRFIDDQLLYSTCVTYESKSTKSTEWGFLGVAMFCSDFVFNFRLPMGMHGAYSIRGNFFKGAQQNLVTLRYPHPVE